MQLQKIFLRPLCICMAMLMVITLPATACSAAGSTTSEVPQPVNSAVYIRDTFALSTLPLDYDVIDAGLLSVDQRIADSEHILVDVSCLEDELTLTLQTAYQNGADILFVGDISLDAVREALNMPMPEHTLEAARALTVEETPEYVDANVIDTSAFPSVAKKISNGLITDITVEVPTPSEIAGAINAALAYDYTALVDTSATDEWPLVDVISREQYMTTCIANTSTELRKSPNNPSSNGQYEFCISHNCHALGRELSYIHHIESEVTGKSTSHIMSFGPDSDPDSVLQFSLSFPWGVSIVNPKSRTLIERVSGYWGDQSLRIRFTPVNGFNIDTPAEELNTEVFIKAYQTDSSYYGIGSSYITTCPSMNGLNQVTYRTNSDILSGT